MPPEYFHLRPDWQLDFTIGCHRTGEGPSFESYSYLGTPDGWLCSLIHAQNARQVGTSGIYGSSK